MQQLLSLRKKSKKQTTKRKRDAYAATLLIWMVEGVRGDRVAVDANVEETYVK